MALTVIEKKGILGFGAFLAGVLLLRRLFGKGDVFIDQVTVQNAEWTKKDEEETELSALQRQAVAALEVDLDLQAPTKKPDPLTTLEIEQTIQKLRAAGRTGDASFLATLLHEAQNLEEGEA